jgi:hypothetical protein
LLGLPKSNVEGSGVGVGRCCRYNGTAGIDPFTTEETREEEGKPEFVRVERFFWLLFERNFRGNGYRRDVIEEKKDLGATIIVSMKRSYSVLLVFLLLDFPEEYQEDIARRFWVIFW